MYACQVIELNPSEAQKTAFARNSAAARIARNDLIALWREEGTRLPGFRYKLSELRPALNAKKLETHPWFPEVSQNAVKGGYIDAEEAIYDSTPARTADPDSTAKITPAGSGPTTG